MQEDVNNAGSSSRSSTTKAGIRRAPIEFVDREGTVWRVTERDTRHDAGSPAQCCLVFANENAVHRVWCYPACWQGLSDAEFDALNREPATRTFRSD